jgi:hypothetical protein
VEDDHDHRLRLAAFDRVRELSRRYTDLVPLAVQGVGLTKVPPFSLISAGSTPRLIVARSGLRISRLTEAASDRDREFAIST